MTDRLSFVSAIHRSTLFTDAEKRTLAAHGSRAKGAGAWHDDTQNEHRRSQEAIAEAVGKDPRTVKRHIRKAREMGWLVPCDDGPVHRGKVPTYRYAIPAPETKKGDK